MSGTTLHPRVEPALGLYGPQVLFWPALVPNPLSITHDRDEVR
ncbi:hypothetical protein [Streptomyces sp. NRRL S-87]|nr:hypothetical protein [Streptomyces sp. NRRL S-87]